MLSADFSTRLQQIETARRRWTWAVVLALSIIALVCSFNTLWGEGALASAALAIAVWVFGLLLIFLGNRDRRHVRIIPYYEREIGGTDTFVGGAAIHANLRELDKLAVKLGVKPLSTFGFADDYCGEQLVWHLPGTALPTVQKLLVQVEDSATWSRQAELVADLRKWEHGLLLAGAAGARFCLILQFGSYTSGFEWDRRVGKCG